MKKTYEAQKTEGKKKESEEVSFKRDQVDISVLVEDAEKATERFRQIVEDIVNRQAGAAFKIKVRTSAEEKSTDEVMVVEEADVKEAQEMIGEGGYYSPEKTSERILDFAKSLSGGDKSKLETLKNAVKEAFEEVEGMLGELPEISKKTYELVMQGFDDWEAED